MDEVLVEEAERILSYYEQHGMNWRIEGDTIALLRTLLPDWSAFKAAPEGVAV